MALISTMMHLSRTQTGGRVLAFAGSRVTSRQFPLAFLSSRPHPSSTGSVSALSVINGRNLNGHGATNSTSETALKYANGATEVDVPSDITKDGITPEVLQAFKKKPLKVKVKPSKSRSDEKPKFLTHRQSVLEAISMLPKVSHAKGSYLYLEDGTRVFDGLAQYGAVPLGHNNQEINDAIVSYLTSNQAAFIQPFMPETTKELSRKLCDLSNVALPIEDKDNAYNFVVFSNSGTETVEAAIKLARTKTERSKILSAANSFHGKTFAALSSTGSTRYSNEHTVCEVNFEKVPMNDIDALAEALESKEFAAFMVEPVQGEGGMVPATEEYLRAAQELCAKTGTKLIFDEVQTGLGRTGAMFAKDIYNVHPDILLLSKALGGGSYPIGAMITKRSAYSNEFDRKHSSTFAGGGVAAAAALKTLELLEDPDVLWNVRQQSNFIENGLSRLQDKFPGILSFEGKGLMWALDFQDPENRKVGNNLVNYMWDTSLSHLICGYLLNEKKLLSMPFLGKQGAIRFEPSLIMKQSEAARFLDAIEEVCTIIQNQRQDILLSYLIGRPTWNDNIHEPFVQKYMVNPPKPPLKEGERRRRFAFFIHLLSLEDTMKQLPPAVKANFSPEDKQKFAEWVYRAGSLEPEPIATQEIDITSATGETVTGVLIGTALFPDGMMKMSKPEKQKLMEGYMKATEDNGVDHIVGLGAFTSVITRAGTQFLDTDNKLFTTGNSFTALGSAESIKEHANAVGNIDEMGVTVIGARGSVGRIAMMELMQHFGHVNIVGNPKSGVEVMEEFVGDCIRELIASGYDQCGKSSSLGQLVALLEKSQTNNIAEGGLALFEHLAELAERHNVELPITITTDATTVVESTNYVLAATNEGKAFLSSDTFLPGTVIFDLARPFDFEPIPGSQVEVFDGGLVNGPEKTMWSDTNIAYHQAGVNLACLSETCALAMEGVEKSYSCGTRPSFSEAKEVYDICIKHGFSHVSYVGQKESKEAEAESDVWAAA